MKACDSLLLCFFLYGKLVLVQCISTALYIRTLIKRNKFDNNMRDIESNIQVTCKNTKCRSACAVL